MRGRVAGLALVVGMLVYGSAAEGSVDCEQEAGEPPRWGVPFDPGVQLSRERRAARINTGEMAFAVARMRLMITVKAEGAPKGWLIVVRDLAGRRLESVGPSDFLSGRTVWTGIIRGADVDVELIARRGETLLPIIAIERGIATPKDEALQFLVFSAQDPQKVGWRGLDKASALAQDLGDNLGFMVGSRGDESWCCSGVFLTSSLFLTNWHCGGPRASARWTAEIRAAAVVDSSWDGDELDAEHRLTGLVASDPVLDFALLRVRGRSDLASLLAVELAPVKSGPAMLLHHAGCRTKVVSDQCEIVGKGADGYWLHTCDSEKGSSGGPIYDAGGRLVGLHHRGFEMRGEGCREIVSKRNRASSIEDIVGKVPIEIRKEIYLGGN